MAILKEDGSLDIERINQLPIEEYIDEACFRWNTRKMSESERFAQMFEASIGLIKQNREFILCNAA